MSSIVHIVVVALTLPLMASTACPPGCICVPDPSHVQCKDGSVDSFPVLDNRVRKLSLHGSRLAQPNLQRSNFTGFQNLEELSLNGCGISLIEYNAFADMTKLKILDLSFNNLARITDRSLAGLRLDFLFMDNNPNIQLQENSFAGMSTKAVSLQNCNIPEVHPAIFRPLIGDLEFLYLSNNKIERFSRNMLEIFQALKKIRIHANPLICDCESRWLKEFYDLNKNTTKIKANASPDPRCAAPNDVQGLFFGRLSVADFSCDKPTLQAGITFTQEKGLLSCVSRGNPLPEVAWHRPSGVVSRSLPQSNMDANTNELELLPTDPGVKGKYKCVASNDGGNISLSVDVDWPFSENVEGGSKCSTGTVGTTAAEVDLTKVGDAESETQKDVFKVKYFTLVDIVGAILGTFVCTLLITIVTLHFCVYRRKKAAQYSTPPMSEYSSSSNGSDKNGQYPIGLHSLHTSHMHSQRPLPHKPYTHKMYDENHYMATNIEERDEFLRLNSSGRATPGSSCDTTCQACRSMPHSSVS